MFCDDTIVLAMLGDDTIDYLFEGSVVVTKVP
jgi:hypothetical protein